MLKSCSRCGKIHDFNKVCYKNRQVRGTSDADKFRKTYKWHKKSEEIRARDKHLCRCCLANIFDTQQVFNFNKLEVHHIVPLEEDYSKRLDDDNLITLCCYHHKLSDSNVIPRNILKSLTYPDADLEKIRAEVEGITIPPTH
jgi:5-methylcytosine-specific restriction protein A